MSGVNKAIIVGHLGNGPDTRVVGDTSVTAFSMATSENWTDKQGNKQERTEWHKVVAWGKLGENCGKYLKKGSQAYVEGRIATRSWEDKEGAKRYTTEIIANTVQFLGSSGGSGNRPPHPGEVTQNQKQNQAPEPTFDKGEDIPF